MPRSLLGALIGAGLVIAAVAGPSSSEPGFVGRAEVPAYSSQSGELITHVVASDAQASMIAVIDPRQRVVGIYHVDRGSGEITLKSVRNFTWDLQMIQYNSGNPLPQDVRSGLER